MWRLRAAGAAGAHAVPPAVAGCDQPDDVCAPPLTIATMDAGVEGSVEIASRQEWAVRYSFLP
jgi:hypothetical protein